MRIAVVADIHGNLLALEAVLADLSFHAPDLVVNLGDHFSGPLQAALTAGLLLSQRGWFHIRGNHDRQLVEHAPRGLGLSDHAALQQLTGDHQAWLRQLAPAAVVAEDILLCHGTPQQDMEYLLEDVSVAGVSIASSDTIQSRLGMPCGAVLCGHSHIPRFISLEDGTIALNPGSVGLQAYADSEHRFPHRVEVGSPHARYALLDRDRHGWRATFRAVDYDWRAAARLAAAGMRPDWAHALLTGYALR